MSNYIVNKNHPLIEREQTYFLDRKLIAIHSNDRDISKWSNSNNFEVELPENLQNVYSLRLINASIPNNIYTFSNNYQNTKFIFRVNPDILTNTLENNLLQSQYNLGRTYTVEINSGYYQIDELQNELENKLNKIVTSTLYDICNNLTTSYSYDKFRVKIDNTSHKITIINVRDNFILDFNVKVEYSDVQCNQKTVWPQYSNWGLPYNLGFNKDMYTSKNVTPNLAFSYDNTVYTPSSDNASNNVKYVESINCIDIFTHDSIYMEVDKYNSMNEIIPYSQNTSSMFNNDYSGRTNSAFAKIPLVSQPFTQLHDSNGSSLNNITFFKVPIPTIRKLKFKFRFHDGTLVDFKNMPFSFVIEANQLIDEQHRHFSVNAPFIYST